MLSSAYKCYCISDYNALYMYLKSLPALLKMKRRIDINVEQILGDTDVDAYRPDGFRILARMIARRCMKDMRPAQMSTNGDSLGPGDLKESRQGNEVD